MPSGEASSKARILAFLADGERQLVVVDDNSCAAPLFVQQDFLHLCRLQRPRHELGRIVREGDDVNLLAAKFGRDHADTGAPGAHAGAHRVHVCVVGPHSNLRAVPRLAGASLDLDDPI